MPRPDTVAVIDIGKTNAKVVLIETATGAQVAVRAMANTVSRDGPYPHADIEGLWRFILAGLKELQAEHGIGAISITTHGATAALVDGEGLVLPVLDYEHDGPEQTARDYAAVRPPFAQTFSPRLPNGLNLGAQIYWQSRRFPAEFGRVQAILTYPQYWAWRLTGVMASEVTSLGCHTDLWAPDKGTFSSLVEGQDWGRLLPPLRPAASVAGRVLPQIVGETGLSAQTPVACGIHDSNASLLPHLGEREAPFTVLSTGTWAICMTVGGSTERLDDRRDSLANVDAHGRPVPTARFMGGREFEMLAGEAVAPSPQEIDRVIRDYIQVLPTFVPGVGPFPHAKGRWTHEPAGLTAGERTAAVSLYLALVTEAALGLCGIGREIVIEGPLARNVLFGQALANMAAVPVTASGDATGTCLGAAMLLCEIAGRSQAGEPLAPLQHAAFADYRRRWQEDAG